jgi:diacylglycerol O-acyltransferase / wax synthase
VEGIILSTVKSPGHVTLGQKPTEDDDMTETPEVHVRQTDAFTRKMERDPLLRSTIVAVTLFEQSPDWQVLEERIERATRLTPTFRQRLVASPLGLAPPRFEFDPDFDLSWHLRRIAAPSPGTLDTVLEFARKAGMAAFDPARPLWEFTLVEGLENGHAALVLKVHHSLTDGIGGIQVAQHVIDLSPEPADLGPLPDLPEIEPLRFGLAGPLLDALGYDLSHVAQTSLSRLRVLPRDTIRALRDPRGAMNDAITTTLSIARFVRPITNTLSPVMTARKLAWHYEVLDLPVDALKRAAKSDGMEGTLNDAFLAAITGGLRRYHERHAASVDQLRVAMPVSVRQADDPEGGNRVTLMRFEVPVSLEHPSIRLRAIKRICGELRHDAAIPYSNTIAGVLNLLPNQVTGGMLKHVDFLASNVPGLDQPVWLGGARMLAFYPFGPTIGAATNITLMSYDGNCCIGVNMDAGAVRDPGVFMECLGEGFDEVLALGDESARRATPRPASR